MKETLKRVKADVVLSALLYTVLGVVLIIWSTQTINIICRILAVGLMIIGAVNLISYFTNRIGHTFSGILGTIVILVGVWIFLRPDSIVKLVPIVIGVILAIHGIRDLQLAFETKSNEYDKWWSILLMGIISVVFGVLCIIHAFEMVDLAVKFIGIALIYDGLSDLWIVSRTVKAANVMRKEAEALDVEYKEVDEEEQSQ